MADPASEAQRYFLGIGGEQTGPFSENEIVDKIRQGQVPPDALVWFEGMSDWQAVQSIPAFGYAFEPAPGDESSAAPAAAQESPVAPIPAAPRVQSFNPVGNSNPSVSPEVSTFSEGKSEPVFSPEEAVFHRVLIPPGQLKALMLLGVVGIFGGAVYYFMTSETPPAPPPTASAPAEAPKFNKLKLPPAQAKTRARDSEAADAQSELLTNPGPSVERLKKLALEDSSDAAGKQAVDSVVQYYRLHGPAEAGRFLMAVKRPAEAIPFFLGEAPLYDEAEKAVAAAVVIETDPEKRKKLLRQDIDLLLNQPNQREVAITRIQEYVKSYPNETNPYAYYLRSTDEKIRELFGRLSYLYTKSLNTYIDGELAQVNLAKRPNVELRREKNGKYRVVAVYKGDIKFNQDHLSNIFFEFWFVKEKWELVGTNLTTERAGWTKAKREKLAGTEESPADLLRELEQYFHTEYPKAGLHETSPTKEPPPS